MSLDSVETQTQLGGDPPRLETSLGEVAYPEFRVGQRVWIDIPAPPPPACQLQLLTRFGRDSPGATGLGQVDGSLQQRSGGDILTGTPQECAQPMAKSGFQHRHAARRCQLDGFLDQACRGLEIALRLLERGATPGNDNPGEAAWQTLRHRFERRQDSSGV